MENSYESGFAFVLEGLQSVSFTKDYCIFLLENIQIVR